MDFAQTVKGGLLCIGLVATAQARAVGVSKDWIPKARCLGMVFCQGSASEVDGPDAAPCPGDPAALITLCPRSYPALRGRWMAVPRFLCHLPPQNCIL